MTTRVVVNLNQEEREALSILAELELRSIRDQIRVLVREQLARHGLLIGDESGNNQESILGPELTTPNAGNLGGEAASGAGATATEPNADALYQTSTVTGASNND